MQYTTTAAITNVATMTTAATTTMANMLQTVETVMLLERGAFLTRHENQLSHIFLDLK